jgi:hypothetical protein
VATASRIRAVDLFIVSPFPKWRRSLRKRCGE